MSATPAFHSLEADRSQFLMTECWKVAATPTKAYNLDFLHIMAGAILRRKGSKEYHDGRNADC